jgi:hypothetical protein
MSYSEKYYGFMVTKSALLEAAGIPFDQMLQILTGITCTAPLVSVLQSKFILFAKITVHQTGNFEVLSCHGCKNGCILNNATLDNGNLKQTTNNEINADDRHPTGIIKKTRVLLNFTGTGVSLNTFYCTDDWHFSTDHLTIDVSWDYPMRNHKPFTLKPPKITDTNADAVIESTSLLIDKITQKAAWPTMTSKVCTQPALPQCGQRPY